MKSFSRWVAIASVLLVGGGVTLAARNSAGTYSLPTGNPVTSGTTITSTWANSTLTDLARGVTDSLDRYGRGAMLAPFRSVDGTASAPGLTFASDTDSGLYRAGANDVRIAVGGADVAKWTSSGQEVTTGFTVTQSTSNAAGLTATGNGSGDGVVGTGGTSGDGVTGVGNGAGVGGRFTGGGVGVIATGGSSGSNGITATGNVAGAGGFFTGGTSGVGVSAGNGTAATSTVRKTALTLRNGDLSLSGVAAPTSTVAVSNALTPSNLVKAWGQITFSDGSAWAVLSGFNVASVATGSTSPFRPTVTMASAMASGNYAVIAMASAGCDGHPSWVQGSNTTTTFTLGIYEGAANSPVAANISCEITFMVLGVQ